MFQRHWCCAFYSLRLPNGSAGYPGLAHGLRGTTPLVLRFLSAIRHECPRYTHAFLEKAQHLWRWITLRMFTRGRLVPRQPRAIKRITLTTLHDAGIYIAIFIHWNTDTTPTALPIGSTHNIGCLHLKNMNIFVDVWAFISLFLVSIHIYFMPFTYNPQLAK